MLERSEGLSDRTEHHQQEIQGIHPHLNSHYCSGGQKTTTPSSVDCVRKLCFYFGTIQGICLFSDDFYSDSTLILTTIAMRQYMAKNARPQVCGVFLMFMFVLTLAGDLCCASFIYPILCWCLGIWISSINLALVSRLLSEDGDRIQSSEKLCYK
jgi:hypothetical protein